MRVIGNYHDHMPFRSLKSFFPTADELLRQDLPTLGATLLTHLKSYEGLNTVYQHAGLNRDYFRAMLENRNVGLGSLPKEPEYGDHQPEVTKRVMEAWNWLEREGLLIPNDQQVADWFIISSAGEELLKSGGLPARKHAGAGHLATIPDARSFRWEDLDNRLLSPKLEELSEELQRRSVEGERKAGFDTRESGNSAGYLPRLFDFQEQLTDEWAQRLYAAHCESWLQQNRTVTGEFIRAVRDRAVLPVIAARKSTVQFEVSMRGTRIREDPTASSLGEWNRRMDRLAARWSQRLEADAVAEEYRASRPPGFNNDDRHFALLAIEEAKKSVAEDARPHPKVGAIVVKDGKILAKAHRGENPKSHAEYVALEEKLSNETLAGATVYTTLEPCTTRNHPKIPCAVRLVERRVARVVIGMLDPDPRITGRGQMALRRARITTDFFPSDLMDEVEELNREFVRAKEVAAARANAPEQGGKEPEPRIFSLNGDPAALLFSGRQHSAHGPFTDLSCGVTVVNYAQAPVKISPLRLVLDNEEWPEAKVFFRPKTDVRQRFARISVRGNDKEDYELHLMFPDEKIPAARKGELWFESDNREEPFVIDVRFP